MKQALSLLLASVLLLFLANCAQETAAPDLGSAATDTGSTDTGGTTPAAAASTDCSSYPVSYNMLRTYAFRNGNDTADADIITLPATLMNNLNLNAAAAIPELATYLVSGIEGNVNKIRRIHDWMLVHLDYDDDCQANNNHCYYGFKEVWDADKQTVCGGYSLIFEDLATAAGFEVEYIVGSATFRSTTLRPHAWNIIKVDGYWYPLDITWDDFHRYNSAYVDYDYFLHDPRVFFNDHYVEGCTALLGFPATSAILNNWPYLDEGYYLYNLNFTEPTAPAVNYNGGDVFRLVANGTGNFYLQPSLRCLSSQFHDYMGSAFVNYDNGNFYNYYSAPCATAMGYLYTRTLLNSNYPDIVSAQTFELYNSEASVSTPTYPYYEEEWGLRLGYLSEPFTYDLRKGQAYTFAVRLRSASGAYLKLEGSSALTFLTAQNSNVFNKNYSIPTGSYSHLYLYASYPGTGNQNLKLLTWELY